VVLNSFYTYNIDSVYAFMITWIMRGERNQSRAASTVSPSLLAYVIYRENFNEFNKFTTLHFTATRALPAAKCMRILPITFGMKVSSYHCPQITGGVENTIPLHVNIFHN
jgi:hypothetical protein